jgi:phenylacetic acid degradation operon negative regulatory protein
MQPTHLIQPLIDHFRQRTPLRTGSLIVTLFGDCIAPRGGSVWLGNLINVLAPLGISGRVVRTAVYRLVQQDILDNEQVGRRSYYTLTDHGRQTFDEATHRIYATNQVDWNGVWHLLITTHLSAEERTTLRKDLEWLGFRSLGSDLLVHPRIDETTFSRHLQTFAHGDKVVCLRGQLPHPANDRLLDLVSTTWQLPALEFAYRKFIALFEPILADVRADPRMPPADAFYLRMFLLHEYRKILLRDPSLPADLLPADWHGHAAFDLTREIYQSVTPRSEIFVDQTLENKEGKLPPADEQFFKRFGGLC